MRARHEDHIISDLECLKSLIDDFEIQVNRYSGIIEIIENLINKYKEGLKNI